MSSRDQELEQKILALYRKGHTSKHIEAELQVGPKRVRAAIIKHGLGRNGLGKPAVGAWTDEEIQTLYRLYIVEGLKVPKIVRSGLLPGRTDGSIRTRLSKCRAVNGRFETITSDQVTEDYFKRKAEIEARLKSLPKDSRDCQPPT